MLLLRRRVQIHRIANTLRLRCPLISAFTTPTSPILSTTSAPTPSTFSTFSTTTTTTTSPSHPAQSTQEKPLVNLNSSKSSSVSLSDASDANPLSLEDEMGRSDSLKRIATLARPEAVLIAKSVATLGVTSSITLLIPSVCGQVIDICLNDPNGVSPYLAAGGLLGLTAVAGAGVVLRSRWLAIAGNRIVARMRQQLFDATLSQDVAFFDRVPTGDLITRLAADTQMIQRAATVQVVSAMRSIVMAAGGTACLMYVVLL